MTIITEFETIIVCRQILELRFKGGWAAWLKKFSMEDDGELSITLSNDVIEPFGDGGFFVLVNGEENHDYEQNGNFVIIPYEAGTSTIEIIGVSVVPEFGAIAGLVLAVAIISIIVLSAKTRLNVIPKF